MLCFPPGIPPVPGIGIYFGESIANFHTSFQNFSIGSTKDLVILADFNADITATHRKANENNFIIKIHIFPRSQPNAIANCPSSSFCQLLQLIAPFIVIFVYHTERVASFQTFLINGLSVF
jgi:hypothetical protein